MVNNEPLKEKKIIINYFKLVLSITLCVSIYGLAHPQPYSARGLTNPPGRCMVESDCIYNGTVRTFIANLVEIEGIVFSPALTTGSQTCLHTFGKRLFLCSVDQKRKLQLKYQNTVFVSIYFFICGRRQNVGNPKGYF